MKTDDQHDFLSPRRGSAPLTPSELAEQLATDYPQLRIHPDAPLVGGMGAVYSATLTTGEGQHHVAIKVLHWHLMDDPAFTARFQREQSLLSQLDHPHIVKLHFTGHTAEGLPFLVMDWIAGRSLTEFTQPGSTTDRQLLLRIADDLCAAAQHAHEKGILHRDLKPQNIIVTPDGRAIVLDFGIARSLRPGHTLTQPGDAPGTHGYIAPEVLAGEKPDARADIYSLGIIIYQLLMKKLPDVFAARPSEHSLDPRFDEIVMKAAASEREKRYASAGALRVELDKIRHSGKAEPRNMNSSSPTEGQEPKAALVRRKVEIIVDEITLTINGVPFFDTLTPEKLAEALREHPRKNGPGNYVWDQSGIQFDQMGGSVRFYFDLDEAKKNGFWSERVIGDAPLNSTSGAFLIYGKALECGMTASQVEKLYETNPTKADCDGLYPDVRGLAISPPGAPITASVEFSRFLPKTLISVTFYIEVKHLKREEFHLADSEGLIAFVGKHPAGGIHNLSLVLTDKHLLVVPEWADKHSHKWDIKDVRGLHLQARGESWWTLISDRDRLKVELTSGRTEHVEGVIERGYGPSRQFGQHDRYRFEQFIRLASLVAKRAGAKHEICFSHPLKGLVESTHAATTGSAMRDSIDASVIACPECQKPIAKNALSCPNCDLIRGNAMGTVSSTDSKGLNKTLEKLNATLDNLNTRPESPPAASVKQSLKDEIIYTHPPGFLSRKHHITLRLTSNSLVIDNRMWRWSRAPVETIFYRHISKVRDDDSTSTPWQKLWGIGSVIVECGNATHSIPDLKDPKQVVAKIRDRIQGDRDGV